MHPFERELKMSTALPPLANSLWLRGNHLSMRRALLCIVLVLVSRSAVSQSSDPAQICLRSAEGSVVQDPPALYSKGGRLEVTLNFRGSVDAQGLERYCYVTDRGLQSPTLHLQPNDRLVIHLHNDLESRPGEAQVPSTDGPCNAGTMGPQFTNLHFHGLSVPPTCHSDEVLKTLVGAGQTFDYEIQIPRNEPPGLYWYHPHVHGYGETQVQGGASGAIVIDGIESKVPALKNLPERTLILRDQVLPGPKPVRSNLGVDLFESAKRKASGPSAKPTWDISLNNIPITYPGYIPAIIPTKPREKQFWRVLNAAADTIFNLQLVVNGGPQPLDLVAVDGVPLGGILTQGSIPLSPGGRVEFLVVTPGVGDKAQLITQNWETGPDGDVDPKRPLANVVASENAPSTKRLDRIISVTTTAESPSLLLATPVQQRTLYFSQKGSDDSPTGTTFFLTVDGQEPRAFRMGEPPNIIAHQGTVEDWTIENRSLEDHVFHIHQLHFKVLEINGKPIRDSGLRDTIDIPYYNEKGPYPSVKLRMDFRDPRILGSFVFHCHILKHQDQGMMGSIQVAPPGRPSRISITSSAHAVTPYDVVTITAKLLNADASAARGAVQFLLDSSKMFEAPLSKGEARFTLQLPQIGKHTLSVSYLGDTSFSSSPPVSLSINVVGSFFVLFPVRDMELKSPSQSARTTLRVDSVGGFDQAVKLSCRLPEKVKAASCVITPSIIRGSGTATLTFRSGIDAKKESPRTAGRITHIAPGSYALTVVGKSGSAGAKIQEMMIVKLRVD